ncbi:MAG: ribosome biogenesis GTPase Der [Gemmatimonadales bacterium]
MHPIDGAVAERLRKTKRPVVLAVNKLDNLGTATEQYDFYSLGLGEPHPLSAISGKGSGDLLDAIVAALKDEAGEEEAAAINVAIVGRPNVGKSSLANRLLGEDRYVVSAEAGTTRDATDSMLRYHGRDLRFVDTAGLRRRSRVDDDVEFYSTVRTHRAIERADVCLLVVDATVGVHAQDLRIATEAWETGAGLIAVVNKWDLIEEKDANTAARGQELLAEKAPFLGDVPFVYVSALSGQRVRKVLDLILEVADARLHRVPTAEVNRTLEALMDRNQPPQRPGEEVKLFYGSQIGEAPPVFAIVSNRPHDVPEHYQRYLLRGLREAFGFKGVPIRLKLRRRKGKGTPR